MKKYLIIFSVISINLFAQFGQNRVQYKELDWQYIQTKHFDIFYSEGEKRQQNSRRKLLKMHWKIFKDI